MFGRVPRTRIWRPPTNWRYGTFCICLTSLAVVEIPPNQSFPCRNAPAVKHSAPDSSILCTSLPFFHSFFLCTFFFVLELQGLPRSFIKNFAASCFFKSPTQRCHFENIRRSSTCASTARSTASLSAHCGSLRTYQTLNVPVQTASALHLVPDFRIW